MNKLIATLFCSLTLSLAGQEVEKHFEKGVKLINEQKYEEATRVLTTALETDPTHVNSRIKRAFAFLMLKDYTSAIDDYSMVLEERPELHNIYNSRGSAYMKNKQYYNAIKDFDKVIELDEKNSEAYNNRGFCKKHTGDNDGACKDWKTSKKMGNQEAKIILKNNRCK